MGDASVPEPGLSLALAVISASIIPLVLMDGEFSMIAASASFCDAFQIDPLITSGGKILALGSGEWNTPQLRSLLHATRDGYADIEAYEMDLERAGQDSRRLVLKAEKLNYLDGDKVWLLLTVSDVTDVRALEKAKDDLLREKSILLQEIQHRVANSLQIVASVLLHSAKRVQSNGTRNHLYNAHQRVMSVAAIQEQLSATRLGKVELKTYLTDLCGSIGASMIRDPKQLTLVVEVDDSVIEMEVSVSLGLIVTELVINALKHAFPGRRTGRITVIYRSAAPGWGLTVRDDGVGMPKDPNSARPGLGTSIVQALAKQLQARFTISNANPGVLASVLHA